MSAAPLLSVRDLHASYGHIPVLHGVSLDVRPGEVVGILGANGAGKTSLVRVISGELKPRSGQVLISGVDVTGASPDRLARAGVATVPEGRGVFPRLTVAEHLRLLARDRRESRRLQDLAFSVFPRLGERRQQLAGTMSGGEQQMLALARAVVLQRPLIVVDELSMGLAPQIVAMLYEHVADLARAGSTIVLVEQFVHDILGVADKAVVLAHGRVVASGTPSDLSGELVEFYLGGAGSSPEPGAAPLPPATPHPHVNGNDRSIR
ncbi:ABC transporter ATP-binding protein [Nocardioides sp. W7]|uniref:ABC transporter ATP-binding protein n=1 Tax=Nocardioides sp. W7 TaxID=2931390 RepID=UPI001FCF89DE|nr:ABC transporter ATP-binding protein [Nocardioides sp. W7]